MGNDKEDSGFGFKDRAKAEETLKLLESHDMSYRKLTVRGLLQRAKRVLTLTKAPEKIKNIKEAMEVFENWQAGLDGSKDKTQEKEKKDDKKADKKKDEQKEASGSDVEMEDKKPSLSSDSVPGLGFKDRETAEGTLKELEGRDPDYQKLAVKGLLGRAKRVLTCTKDETKLANIKEAMSIFDNFLDEFDSQHLSKQNNAYVALNIVRTCLRTAEERGLGVEHQKAFIQAYSDVNGEYKRLRTVAEKEGGKTWDIVRNTALKDLKERHADAVLFKDNDEPTDEHLELLLWAYSPEPAKVKKLIPETKPEAKKVEGSRKRKSGSEDEEETPSKKKK